MLSLSRFTMLPISIVLRPSICFRKLYASFGFALSAEEQLSEALVPIAVSSCLQWFRQAFDSLNQPSELHEFIRDHVELLCNLMTLDRRRHNCQSNFVSLAVSLVCSISPLYLLPQGPSDSRSFIDETDCLDTDPGVGVEATPDSDLILLNDSRRLKIASSALCRFSQALVHTYRWLPMLQEQSDLSLACSWGPAIMAEWMDSKVVNLNETLAHTDSPEADFAGLDKTAMSGASEWYRLIAHTGQ
ncbi:unnamed protein product [Protopolystoma xenopodis]|uniref:Uncharacterized protein n=1 Tax=Protopolystoma xenopodis TaxID=117903 RepID=A0A3S5BRI1_9PLAT|nr:unnamed protein product [Protopolystoma xenopodis]